MPEEKEAGSQSESEVSQSSITVTVEEACS